MLRNLGIVQVVLSPAAIPSAMPFGGWAVGRFWNGWFAA